MNFFEVISNRKTIRKYKELPPPIEDIKRIIDTARLAPSATNTQNWRFIAVYNQEIKQKMLGFVNKRYDEIIAWEESKEFKNQIEGYRNFSTFFINAPVVIVCIENSKTSYMNDIFKNKFDDTNEIQQARPDSSLLSMGAAIENMSLAATALGYGTCWMCAPVVAYKGIKNIFNISSESKVVALLTVGYPEENTPAQPIKKQLNEIMEIIE